MSKQISAHIVGILNDDLETYYRRTIHDWKWDLRETIKKRMRSKSLAKVGKSIEIHYVKYLKIISGNDKLIVDTNNLYIQIPKDQDCNDSIVTHNSRLYNIQIIDTHLKTLIDYCRSQKLDVYFTNDGWGDRLIVSWEHWDNK